MYPNDDVESGSADLFDREKIREYFVFVAGSVRRRGRLLVAVFSCVMVTAIAALIALPSTYHVEAKLLTQRNPALAVRGEAPDAAALTHGAGDLVHRRDNLVALIHATDLIDHWQQHRAPAHRAADAIRWLLRGEESVDDRIDTMVERLEKRLVAWTNGGTVSIAIDWPDPRMACRLVDLAQQNFLEARHAHEITALSESLAILQSHAENLRADIDEAVAALGQLRAERQPRVDGAAPRPAESPAGPRRAARRAAETGDEIERLRVAIAAKQRALEDLEGFRRHRLSELQARLAEQRATYTENYPSVIDLKQTIASVTAPSSQVKALRDKLAELKASYEKGSGGARDASGTRAPLGGRLLAGALPQLPSDILLLSQDLREERDPATARARAELRDAMDKYAALREKVQAAQIDLEMAQAAFKYRYSVLTPAQLPKRASKPNVPLVLLAAFVAAIFGGIFVTVVADLRSGRVVERWQIERLLDRPILGEVEVPRRLGRGLE